MRAILVATFLTWSPLACDGASGAPGPDAAGDTTQPDTVATDTLGGGAVTWQGYTLVGVPVTDHTPAGVPLTLHDARLVLRPDGEVAFVGTVANHDDRTRCFVALTDVTFETATGSVGSANATNFVYGAVGRVSGEHDTATCVASGEQGYFDVESEGAGGAALFGSVTNVAYKLSMSSSEVEPCPGQLSLVDGLTILDEGVDTTRFAGALRNDGAVTVQAGVIAVRVIVKTDAGLPVDQTFERDIDSGAELAPGQVVPFTTFTVPVCADHVVDYAVVLSWESAD